MPAVIYASSVGAYGPGPKDRLVDESWPTTGIPSLFYSRHKVAVERLVREHPGVRVVRMRPGADLPGQAATEIRRLFAGPLLPMSIVKRSLIPVVPAHPRLCFQVVHSLDVGDAYRRALLSDVRGAFNLAADLPIGPEELAQILHARPVKVPALALRAAAAITYTCSPANRGGLTWAWPSRCWTAPERAASLAGSRRATLAGRCSS